MNSDSSVSPATGFGVHPVVLVVSDPHAAVAGASLLSGANRRLDGPFFYWSGKAGLTNCVILVPTPGGAAAWYAAAELACRRCEPSMLVGITRAHWLAATSPPDGFCAHSVVACDFPPDFVLGNDAPAPNRKEQWIAPGLSRRLAAAWRDTPDSSATAARAKQKAIALCRLGCLNPSVMEIPSVPSGLLGEWDVEAMDHESSGLARAASARQIPWAIVGGCTTSKGDDFSEHWRGFSQPGDNGAFLGPFLEECVRMIDNTNGFQS